MRAQEMKVVMTMVARLTSNQRHALLTSLSGGLARCEAIDVVESRLGRASGCPKCQGAAVVRNGRVPTPLQRQEKCV